MFQNSIFKKTILIAFVLMLLTPPVYVFAHVNHGTDTEQNESGTRAEKFLINKTTEYLNRKGPWFAFLLMIMAFVLGVFHTITPGHGKAIIASYLVGTRVRLKDAITLGLSTAITHVLDVFIVMIVFVFILKSTDMTSFSRTLAVISSCLIIAFGAYGLNDAIREFRNYVKSRKGDSHTHSHDHHHHHDLSGNKRRPFILGVFLGMAPCPMAWVLFLIALSLNKMFLGFLMMISFSAAIVFTILLLTYLIFKFKEKVKIRSSISVFFPVLSYVLIIGFGILLVLGF